MTKAYSYVRFSSKAQADGASLSRQLKSAREYAKTHDLVLDDSSYQDLGVSAFKGANAIDGELGVFIAAVETGKIARGSYLLLESFDRMSRNVVMEAQALFHRILKLDIIIVTLLDGQVFSKEKINEDGGMSIMMSIMYMLRAHEESKTKSKRVKDGWERARNTKKIITRIAPSWLKIVDDDWEVIEEKASVIKRIFKLALEGKGSPKIAKILNEDKVLPLGPAFDWTSGMVAGFMKSPAVIGSLVTAKIPLREGYYPPIIDKDVFYSVQQLITSRNLAPGPRDNSAVGNLFAARSFCHCGARMKTSSISKSRVLTNPEASRRYLICEDAYGTKKCKNPRRVSYDAFEEQLLSVLIVKQGRTVFSFGSEASYDPRPALEAELIAKDREIEKHMDFMSAMPNSPALLKRLAKLETEQEELKKTLSSATRIPTTPEALESVVEIYDKYLALKQNKDSDEYKKMRQELQTGLRRVVKKIVFHHLPPDLQENKEFFEITFQSDTVRTWHYTKEPIGVTGVKG